MLRRFVFSTTDSYTIGFDPNKYLLFAEGDEGDAGASGDSGGSDGDTPGGTEPGAAGDGDAGKTEVDSGTPAPATSFKDALTSDASKKFAESSPDLEHLVDRAVTMRAELSKAIIPPGKDASDTDVAAYRKKIGVPEGADGYTIKMPEGQEPTDIDTAFHTTLSETFHKMNISTAQADALNAAVNDHTVAMQQMVVDNDKKYADESLAELHRQWPDNYDENFELSQRTMDAVFPGDEFEEYRNMELKDGTLIADNPMMLRAFAVLGQQMKAGGLSPVLSEGEMDAATDQIKVLRDKQAIASADGNTKEANRLYTQEQNLLRKTNGTKGVVGSQGRAA